MSSFRCPGCGYCYDESVGDDHEGYPPGFAFADLPDDFVCPDCSVRYKEDFVEAVEPEDDPASPQGGAGRRV